MRSALQFLFLGLCFCKLGVAILIATAVALPNWWETLQREETVLRPSLSEGWVRSYRDTLKQFIYDLLAAVLTGIESPLPCSLRPRLLLMFGSLDSLWVGGRGHVKSDCLGFASTSAAVYQLNFVNWNMGATAFCHELPLVRFG